MWRHREESKGRRGDPMRLLRFARNDRLLCFCLIFLSACATSFDKRGQYYKVRQGESLYKIAKFYRISAQELAEINNIQDPSKMTADQKLYIPERPKKKSFKKLPKAERLAEEKSYTAPVQTDHSKFMWPVEGTIFSGFGVRNGRRHDGIDIAVKNGTPIKAAAVGKVVFSDRLGGYGNAITIRHPDNFFSIYAHNQKNLVKDGKKVKQGELIAQVGHTGRATGPHCHFEIRDGQKARNPLFFLPTK